MAYITVTEANEFMGTSWEDTLVTSLISYSESLLNTKLNVTTLESVPHDEEHKYNGAGPYYVKELNPTVLTTVDNLVITGTYKFFWRKLLLEYSPTPVDIVWNMITLQYTAWYVTIPEDIKTVMLMLVSWVYNKRKSVGIKSFEQGEVSVTYNTQEEVSSFQDMYNLVISKYSKNDIYS